MFWFLNATVSLCFQNNTCLTSLNIMCNNFGEEGAKHLAEALEVEILLFFLFYKVLSKLPVALQYLWS